ncbi:dihydroorotase [Sulfoacidibacillus thermotolerans]|uniref:Dihydroorotase n=2 Tax=Sulfoacidibacillus thermotolerans TaxID=1765684 RepID=A0A2U3D7W8_SULT2|nr:dihydroorotase [Sulfoacidibacillus thermotolerans]
MGYSTVQDLLVEGQIITALGKELPTSTHEVIDLRGLHVMPGLIDPHVHLREPGQTHKETIETGTMAAAAGGFTQICCMPNTTPIVDERKWVHFIREEADRFGYATVHPIAAITKGAKGQEVTDFVALHQAGAVAFSDDGKGVQSAQVMRQALLKAKQLGVPIVVHAEDESLSGAGCMNAGPVAERLGVPGIVSSAETVMIARDVLLAQETGAHVHMCHVSPEAAVQVIRCAKESGAPVTAEVTPHHLLLTDEQVEHLLAQAKVNPPLRAESDRAACVRGLLDGTLDMIATDHAPHTKEEKDRGLLDAPFGFVGLEISFPLMYTAFVKSGILPFEKLVYLMSTAPAKHFHLRGGRIQLASVADFTVVDLNQMRRVNPEAFRSKGRNTPFVDRELWGWPVLTIHRGQTVFQA